MSGILIAIIVFLVAVILNGFFAGYETGFVSVNPIRIRYMATEEHHEKARRLLHYIERPNRMLTTLLIGTNLALIAGTIALARQVGDLWATVVATPTYLVLSEFMPKSIFRTHPNRLTLAFLPAMRFFDALFAPLAVPMSWVVSKLLRKEDQPDPRLSPFMSSVEDVRVLIDEIAEHGTIKREEQRMIHSVINLQRRIAKEIMVPRIDIEALPVTATRQELLNLFVDTGRTRIPVYEESVDRIIGVANAHDVLLDEEPENQDIRRFIRPVMHVPDTMGLGDLFASLKQAQQHLAIVTDEYGGTDGLVTLEDIVEEIFGEIQDEHDREESPIHKVGEDAYVVEARMSLEEAGDFIGIPIEDDEVETVGGWLMHVAGRIPGPGEVIVHNGFRLTVLDAGVNFVSKIRLEVLPEAREHAKES